MRKLLNKKQGFAPKLLVIDKLRSYPATFRRLRLTLPARRMYLEVRKCCQISLHSRRHDLYADADQNE